MHAEWPVGRGAFSARVSAGLAYDSNLTASADGVGDAYLTVTPAVEYLRDAALLQLRAAAGATAEVYASETYLTGVFPRASADAAWVDPGGKTDAAAGIAYVRVSEANTQVNARTESDQFTARLTFGHLPAEKYGYRLRADGSLTDYLGDQLATTTEIGAGIDARHVYSEKLEFALALDGTRAQTAATGSRPVFETLEVALRLVADGELLPKVSGRVALGWSRLEVTKGTGAPEDAPSADLAVTWTPEERTTVTLTGGVDYNLSPNAESYLGTTFLLSAAREIAAGLTLSAAAGFTLETYLGDSGREDTIGQLRAGATYAFNRTTTGSASVRWEDSSSTLPQATYSRVLLEAGVTTRF